MTQAALDIAAAPIQRTPVLETGQHVGVAQTLLKQYFQGTDIRVDNQNGGGTSRLIARFQRAEGLIGQPGVQEGRVDDLTIERLRAGVANGGYLGLVARLTGQTIVDVDGPRQVQGGRNPIVSGPSRFSPAPTDPSDVTPRGVDVHRYTIRAGDTLDHIAKAHNVSRADLLRYNPGMNPAQMRENDLLVLPPGAQRRAPQVAFDTDTERQPTPWENAPQEADWRRLERGRPGATGDPLLTRAQERLAALGYRLGGTPDGKFGERTQAAVRAFQGRNGLNQDGIINTDTWRALANPNAQPAGKVESGRRFAPGSPEQIALFTQAGIAEGLSPAEAERWARSPALQYILGRESDGRVGRLNYTYRGAANDESQWGRIHDQLRAGRITARSSATGLGQLLLKNVRKYYPSGVDGIGVPIEEARGMIRYVREHFRYRDRRAVTDASGVVTRDNSIERARAMYGVYHEGY